MEDKDIILIGQAINGLGDAREILRVLVDKGVLSVSWREIESVLETIQAELGDVEVQFAAQAKPWPVGAL